MSPSPTTLRHLLETEQDNAFLDLLIVDMPGSQNTKINVLSGWRVYFGWVRSEGLSILNADQAQATAFAEWLKQNYEAPSTRNNRLTQVRRLYQRLQEAELVSTNPFDDLHGEVNPAHERRKNYTPDEVQRLLLHADTEEKLLILLGAHAGLTISEVRNLLYEDFHDDDTFLELSDRTITCTPELTDQLKQWVRHQGDTPLFPVRPTGEVLPAMSAPALRSKIFDLCRRANVPYKAWHALRNAAGVKMLQENPERHTVMRELGLTHRMALRPMVKISGQGDGRRRKR